MNKSAAVLIITCLLVQCHCIDYYMYMNYGYLSPGNGTSLSHEAGRSHNESPCPPWYITNNTTETKTQRCKCQRGQQPLLPILKCKANKGGLLQLGYCITQNETNGQYTIGQCPYSQANIIWNDIVAKGYIRLPDNISELNDYICHPMNRTGFMCHNCIPGFGPSVTSAKFQCTNCTDAWRGPLLYLLVEYVPITVIYLVILFSRTNITSAPMTCLIMLSQVVVFEFNYDHSYKISHLLMSVHAIIKQTLLVFYGSMNLEFLHYIVPPFCISKNLQILHVVLLGYLSAFYPLCLVLLTWVCVELHDRNFKLLVLLWKPFHRCWVRLRNGLNLTHDLVDVFASFFLLSYSKILYQSMLLVGCCHVVSFESDLSRSGHTTTKYSKCFDPSMSCNNREHLRVTIPAAVAIIIFSILPALLLVLYPIRSFRTCLSKCKLDGIAITVFVDKFHSCYRDGLNGGRDMRSLSGLYFFLRFYGLLYILTVFTHQYISVWICNTLVTLTPALLIAYIKPYRKRYMNILDTLLLLNATLVSLLLSQKLTTFLVGIITVLLFLPVTAITLVVILKFLKLVQKLVKATKCCRCTWQWMTADREIQQDPQNQQLIAPTSITSIAYGTST